MGPRDYDNPIELLFTGDFRLGHFQAIFRKSTKNSIVLDTWNDQGNKKDDEDDK